VPSKHQLELIQQDIAEDKESNLQWIRGDMYDHCVIFQRILLQVETRRVTQVSSLTLRCQHRLARNYGDNTYRYSVS
jgi:hypothetical protein